MSEKNTFGAYMEQDQTQTQAPTETIIAEAQPASQEQVAAPATTVVDNEGKLQEAAPTTQEQAPATPKVEDISSTTFDLTTSTLATPETQVLQTQAASVVDWKEELKKVDPFEAAKTIGISDFAIELDKHMKNGGSPLDYLNAKAINYNEVSDEDLIKAQLRDQLPNASPKQIDLWIEREFNQGEFADDDEKEFGLMKMQAEAQKIRQAKIAQQQSFKIADPINNPQNDEEFLRQQEELQQKIQKYTDAINNSEATKTLLNGKRVTVNLGEGTPAFNFNIGQPEVLMELFSNGEAWQKAISLPTGEPDVAKMQRVALAVLNPNYEKSLVDYGKSLGKKALIEEGQNAQRPNGNPPSDAVQGVTPTGKKGTFGQYVR